MDGAVMGFWDDLTTFVDERIMRMQRPAQGSPTLGVTAMGTVVSAPAGSIYAFVNFDGSNASMPVKTFANVRPKAGDRVGLVKYGSDWVITGTYGFSAWPRPYGIKGFFGTGTTTSSSMVDMPGTPEFTFVKQFDETAVMYFLAADTFCTVDTNTTVQHDFAWKRPESSGFTYPADSWAYHYFNLTSKHDVAVGMQIKAGYPTTSFLRAGTITFRIGWNRLGLGTLNTDPNCPYSAYVLELHPDALF